MTAVILRFVDTSVFKYKGQVFWKSIFIDAIFIFVNVE